MISLNDSPLYQHNCFQFYQMIINSTDKEPFCKRVQYSHETDVFLNNRETQDFVDNMKSTFRVKKCMSAPKIAQSSDNYNHYYVNPELRFIKRTIAPKNQQLRLLNDEHVYYKLHDQKLNSWQHPFEKSNQQKEHLRYTLNDNDVKKLLKFKSYVQSKGKGRVPLLVSEYIKQKK